MKSLGVFFLAVIVAGTLACSRSRTLSELSSPTELAADSMNVIRLADLLSEASIESPLNDVPAFAALSQLASEVSSIEVFREDFEGSAPDPAYWLGGPTPRVEPRPGGEPGEMALTESSRGRLFVIPAKPSTYYKLERRLLRISADCPDIEIRESDLEYQPRDLKRFVGDFLTPRGFIKVHQFSLGPLGRWNIASRVIFTTPATRSLVIIFRQPISCEAWLDEVLAEELQPTPQQEISLLKGQSLAEGSDPDLGMVKQGFLLPLPAVTAAAPYDENYSVREALFAPAPTDIVIHHKIRDRARLRFSYALAKESRPGDRATFRVTVRAPGKPERELFKRTITLGAGDENWHWHEACLDLLEFAGQTVRLALETRTQGADRGFGLWGDPVIDIPRSPTDPPNVILIAVDTLRADRLGAYGYENANTPGIDRFAGDAVLFQETICQALWTLPSFSSLFTGAMPRRHRMSYLSSVLSPEFKTLAEHFRGAGWATQAIMYKPALYDTGLHQGFDRFFNIPDRIKPAEDVLVKALRWLENNHDRRFFLFLHFNDPHQPFSQNAPFLKSFEQDELGRFGMSMPVQINDRDARTIINLDPWETENCTGCRDGDVLSAEFKSLARRLYDGEVTYVDHTIGRFLAALKSYGLYDDAIIAFVSDHGESLWDHAEFFGHQGPCYYDELMRVPLIIKPPSGTDFRPGTAVPSQVRMFDLMPTLLELAGLEVSGLGVEAASLVPMLDGGPRSGRIAVNEPGIVDTKDLPPGTMQREGSMMAVRAEGWKYVNARFPETAETREERLYHLMSDPGESQNLAHEQPNRLRNLRAIGLDNLIRNRGGNYLVVTADGTLRLYDIRIRNARSGALGEVLFGQHETERVRDGAQHFSGRSSGDPLLLLVRFNPETDPEFVVDVVETHHEATVRYQKKLGSDSFRPHRAGDLGRLLTRPGRDIFAFTVEQSYRGDRRQTHDAAQLEALKALGYIQ